MKKITSTGNSYLWFPKQPSIIHRWQTMGLIVVPEEGNPEVLNYFRIFISANTKQKVEDFVNYQKKKVKEYLKKQELNQLEDGQVAGIQVFVKKIDYSPATPPPPPIQTNAYSQDEFMNLLENAELDFLASSGEINIGIDRVDMHTQPPYEICYVIDPETKLLSQNGKYSIQFSADQPSISCHTERGRVDVKTYELTKQQTWKEKDSRMVSGPNPGFPNLRKEFTGNWQVDVFGIDQQNNYVLRFTKAILR